MKFARTFVLTASLSALAAVANAAGYDAAAQFSTTNNPNGVWSYGYTTGAGFVASPAYAPSGSVAGWTDSSVSLYMGVYGAGSNLLLHPGEAANQKAILRFTAPSAGQYSVAMTFANGDNATTDYSVMQGLTSHASGSITPSSGPQSHSFLVNLGMGDTLDTIVGLGSNGNYYNDSTLVKMNVEAVPEPASMAALGLGALGVLRRRAKRA